MSKWQLSWTLASFPLLADYSSIKLTSEASLNLSRAVQTAAQIIEFLPDANAFTNKFRGLRHVKTQPANAMAHRFDIEKRHWGRYQIIRTKLHRHKQYGMGGTDKHEIGEYETGKDETSEY